MVVLFFGCSTSSDGNGNSTTDVDGNVYQYVTICSQTWLQSNLNVSKYSDGTPITQVTSPTDWENLTTGAWCYYENNTANGPVYGKLYNWYAVAGIYDVASLGNSALRKKLAPMGWHVPSDGEWTQLTDCLGGESVAGGKMKATGTIQAGNGLWQDPNTAATNESGFTGLPGGYRSGIGMFNYVSNDGNWWSSSENSTTNAWVHGLGHYDSYAYRGNSNKDYGFSVRCVRD